MEEPLLRLPLVAVVNILFQLNLTLQHSYMDLTRLVPVRLGLLTKSHFTIYIKLLFVNNRYVVRRVDCNVKIKAEIEKIAKLFL